MSYIGKVKDTNGVTGLIGSTLYGTCSTAESTVAKIGTLTDFDELLTGVTIHIKFTNSNTATNPTLNVNSTGAKRIYKYGTTSVGTTVDTSWAAGAVVSLTYDGNGWQMNDHIDNTNTDIKVSQQPIDNTDQSTYRIILSNTGVDTQQTDIVNKSSFLLYKPSTGELTAPKMVLSNSFNYQSTLFNVGISPEVVGSQSTSYKMLKIYNNSQTSDQDWYITPGLSDCGSLGHPTSKWENVYATTLNSSTLRLSTSGSGYIDIESASTSGNPKITIPAVTGNAAIIPTTEPTISNANYRLAYINATNRNTVITDSGIRHRLENGTTTSVGVNDIMLGNSTPSGTAGNRMGMITLYTETDRFVRLSPNPNNYGNNVTLRLPTMNANVLADVLLYSITTPDQTEITTTTAYTTYSYESFKISLYINNNSFFTCELWGEGYHQIIIPTGMNQSATASFRLTIASILVQKQSDGKYKFTLTKGKTVLISGSTVTTESTQPTIYFKKIMGICRN